MIDLIRVGIVAPTLAMRTGLRILITEIQEQNVLPSSSTIQVMVESADLDGLLKSADELDIVLLAVETMDEVDLKQFLAGLFGQVALLFLTDDSLQMQALYALPLRSWGILPLDSSPEEIAVTLLSLQQGMLVISPILGTPVFKKLSDAGDKHSASLDDESLNDRADPLTERERQVLQLLARGLANKQIALSLGISEHTVKFHISSIYTKLGVMNRAEAVRKGIQQGLVLL